MNHVEWSTKTAVIVGMATILSLVMVMNDPKVCLGSDQFSIGFGYRPGGYAVNGRGQYGYNHGGRSGYYRGGQNRLAPYGNGPYGYGNTTGYSGWNPNYNSYSPYTSHYYSPYPTYNYSPYGVGIYRPYGY